MPDWWDRGAVPPPLLFRPYLDPTPRDPKPRPALKLSLQLYDTLVSNITVMP
jgi:hypothetical protein